MKKSFLSFVLSLLVLNSSVLAYDPTFLDVEESHSNFVAIEYLVSIGTLEGYDDGTFRPDQDVNRAELMKILVSGQGIEPNEEVFKDCFTDVGTEWYAPYVCYAEAQGWVEGYDDGSFLPANTINKVEAVKMLVNSMEWSVNDTVDQVLFDDTDNTLWYAPYLEAAKDLNVLEETSGDFNPSWGMDRAGVAEQIFRADVLMEMGEETYSESIRDSFLDGIGMGDLISTSDALEVSMDVGNFFFGTESIVATPGQLVTITFSNVSGTHHFVIDELGVDESISEGDSFTFNAPLESGDYTFYCSVSSHQSMGMEGTLTVE